MSKTTVVIGWSLLRGRRGRRGRWHSEALGEPDESGLFRFGMLAEHGEVMGAAREEEHPLRLRGCREELLRRLRPARVGLAGEKQRRARRDLLSAGERKNARLVHGNRHGGVPVSYTHLRA